MIHRLRHNILYSCVTEKKRDNEELVIDHALGYIISGEAHFKTNGGQNIFRAGECGLIRKNLLIKSVKVPAADGTPFKSLNIFLDQPTLRAYCAENHVEPMPRYAGESVISLKDDTFIKSYLDSLLPYFEQPEQLTLRLAKIKTVEAIELLLTKRPHLKSFLFDFTQPFKIELEKFMSENFTYHIRLTDFARLSGRSLATFKRDFKKTFNDTPERWLLNKRLDRAHYLISEKKQKASDVFLEVGFENLSHFSTSFKNLYGYTPKSITAAGT